LFRFAIIYSDFFHMLYWRVKQKIQIGVRLEFKFVKFAQKKILFLNLN